MADPTAAPAAGDATETTACPTGVFSAATIEPATTRKTPLIAMTVGPRVCISASCHALKNELIDDPIADTIPEPI